MRILAALVVVTQVLSAKTIDKNSTIAGMILHYTVVLPKDYDAAKEYPAILAFPPGAQNNEMVQTTLQRNWGPEAQRRGYIVIIPAAPQGRLFFEEGSKVFPAFLDQLLHDYKIKGNKFHIAGMSNGGLSAFYVAAAYPQYFTSVTGFPGYLPEETPAKVSALSKMCIRMHVGELDSGWREAMQAQANEFRSKGYTVAFTIEKGQSHVIGTLAGDGASRLFNEIEACR